MNKQLEGVKVIDFTLFAAGPACGKMLADWGAEVIKVEPLQGEAARMSPGRPYNPTFEVYNANKKGLTLNMKSEKGMEIMDKLLGEADVFVTSYRTDALARLGLDYETVSKKHPHVVWAQINGFGDLGPDAARPGFDTVAFWARSGALGDFVEKGSDTIMNAPVAFGDVTASCSLSAGICAALYNRSRTGKGEKVMVSLLGQAIYCLNNTLVTIQDGDRYPKTRKMPIAPLMNSFKCKDGKWIMLCVIEYDRYYASVFKMIGREDLIADEKYSTFMSAYMNMEEFTQIMDEGFAKITQDEAVEALVAADIAHERVNQVKDIFQDEQAKANQYIADYIARDGRAYVHASSPVKFGDVVVPKQEFAPLLGENSVEILKTLQYSDEEIEAFLAEKVTSIPNVK